MVKIAKFFRKKKSAQAMAEFAIALPILLLLLYGIIETGRLLFMYSTVVTASRQAVRYGATTGEGNNGVPRYQDCDGMRHAANRVGFLGQFDTITLQYDQGVTNTNPPAPINPTTYCTGSTDSSLTTQILEGNRTRLVVTVTERFHPIVPKLVPFIERDITASSARTILYSVPIVVEQEQQEWFKNPTTLEITLDDPDPSEMHQAVTVNVQVTGGSPAPTGEVQITGADTNCTTTIDGSGFATCQIIFDTVGSKVITAFYVGDENSLASSDAEDHQVTLSPTVVQFTTDQPDPSTRDQLFVVAVRVTGGTSTPTGTVDIDGGQGVRCTIPLSMGIGSCALSYNNTGVKTLTATYSGDSLHLASSATEPHTVLDGTPTPTATPTITPIPTNTPTPTATILPTPTPTTVPSCTGITAPGGITISGNAMIITINNPYVFTLTMKDLTVTWNEDKGHNIGSKKLRLQLVTVGGTTIWAGDVGNQSTLTIPTTATLNPGNTTIVFYFDQTYDNRDTTENVYINWLTPGCEGNPINVR